MTPRFILPSDYASREMTFSLAPVRGGWQFFGRDADNRYSVPARNPAGELLCNGETFRTKHEAAIMARALDLPPYQIWNGRKRRFEGEGAKFPAHARNKEMALRGYIAIAGGYHYAPLRCGLTVRAPDGREVYCQPGDDEAAMRANIDALDEIDGDDKRAIVADMVLGEYFA